MLVTINTDASWHPKENVAGFAFWAVCNDWKIQKCGGIRDQVFDSSEAEAKAILNAVFVVLHQGKKNISRIIINTDSQAAINLFTFPKAKMNSSQFLIKHKHIRSKFNVLTNNIKIEFRHVKGHSGTDTARQWVNDWCDKQAKAAMKNRLKKEQSNATK